MIVQIVYGVQSLTTKEGYIPPLYFKRGLAYIGESATCVHSRHSVGSSSQYNAVPLYRGHPKVITQEGFDNEGGIIGGIIHPSQV